jgi:transposase
MAADEGRFGRLGEVRSCWCPKGIRPIVPKQQVREYVYAYAAVAPELGQMTCLVLPYANTKMMNLFLKQVSEDFQDYFIIMQVDKAAWHRSKSLQIPENIRLLTQPAHSPELMPVEHLWENIRENYFYNRVFKSMSKVVDELCKGIVDLVSDPERLRSMTYFPHLKISSLNAT